MKIYKIRCAKCGKHFSGDSISAIMQENSLEKIGKYYVCSGCSTEYKPKIKSKPKKEKNSFFEKAQDDFQG